MRSRSADVTQDGRDDMSLPESALDGESQRCGGAQGLDKRRGAEILASRSDEGGDRGETHLVASGDVEGAPRTCAGHDRSLGMMLKESPLGSVGHLKLDSHRYGRMFQGDLKLF